MFVAFPPQPGQAAAWDRCHLSLDETRRGLRKFDKDYLRGKVDRLVVKALLPYLSSIISGEWEKEETIERLEKNSEEVNVDARAKALRRLRKTARKHQFRKRKLWTKIKKAVLASNVTDEDLCQTANSITSSLVEARQDRVDITDSDANKAPIWTLDMVEEAASDLIRGHYDHGIEKEYWVDRFDYNTRQIAEEHALKVKKTKIKSDPNKASYEPRSYRDSRKCAFADQWRKADEREDFAWHRRGVYTIVKRSTRDRSKPLLRSFRVYKYKPHASVKEIGEGIHRTVVDKRYKGRLICDGRPLTKTLPWQRKYSPTVRTSTVRLLFAMAARYKLKVWAADLSESFLQSPLEKIDGKVQNVYMEIPPEFRDGDGKLVDPEDNVLFIKKSIYGISNAPRLLYLFLREKLEKIGFKKSQHDAGLFSKVTDKGLVFLASHVDDLLIVGSDDKLCEGVITDLMEEGVDLTGVKNPEHYVGMRIRYGEDGIRLDTQEYVEKLLEKHDRSGTVKWSRLPASPTVSSVDLEQARMAVDRVSQDEITRARGFVGEVLYECMRTSPDIAVAVNRLACNCQKPSHLFWSEKEKLVGYLRWRSHLKPCLFYRYGTAEDGVDPILTGISDASMSTTLKSRAMMGWLLFFEGSLINYKCGYSKISCLSTTDSEVHSLSDCAKEMLFYIQLLSEQGINVSGSNVATDNLSVLKNSLDGSMERTRHVNWRVNHVKDCIEDGLLNIFHIKTSINCADLLSKPVRVVEQFEFLRSMLMECEEAEDTLLESTMFRKRKRKEISIGADTEQVPDKASPKRRKGLKLRRMFRSN